MALSVLGIQYRSRQCATFRPADSLKIMSRIAKLSAVPVLVVMLGVAGVGQADARRGAVAVCGSSAGHTVIARNTQAEIYRLRERTSDAATYEYRGCVYGSQRSLQLGLEAVSCSPYGCSAVNHVTLAGTTVAYEAEQSEGIGETERSEWKVVVLELRVGRVLHKVPTGVTYPPNPNFVGDGPVTAIVAKRNGAVAWTLDTVQSKNRYQVHALDATGERVLAVGSNIAPNSLALAGSTLYWTQGGKPASALLD
jgi:hypothetical protein